MAIYFSYFFSFFFFLSILFFASLHSTTKLFWLLSMALAYLYFLHVIFFLEWPFSGFRLLRRLPKILPRSLFFGQDSTSICYAFTVLPFCNFEYLAFGWLIFLDSL